MERDMMTLRDSSKEREMQLLQQVWPRDRRPSMLSSVVDCAVSINAVTHAVIVIVVVVHLLTPHRRRVGCDAAGPLGTPPPLCAVRLPCAGYSPAFVFAVPGIS